MWEKLIKTFLEKNSQINLSAIKDEEGVRIKHIQDSLEINKILTFKPGSSIIDVGTGGGFPLIPMAISNPKCNFVGLDSKRKKIEAVNEIIEKLGIQNVYCKRGRAEQEKQNFDYITARAVGYADKLLQQITHLTKKQGYIILYKQFDEEELEIIKKSSKKLNLKIHKQHNYSLFENDINRVIYILKKC
ncbi:16S rRNA (guanine(527)-N(7))-methyltransferase RsmG [Candidatus Absconditicoccus praedator]|uniref:16S rRNA (guanine(527)-N(7))-methyltransferase RsmG n=1 Tax=Candidatus Absconditicoccus praedator TaxID=2735562 RepID=UPI001E53A23D|nr:16S rRNA (guanine(527)-N(7))-methyltransferase RsmG [Candidatus Absconditicoccus praedator]UFX83144.1 16S rRNA (guanine(527)-N(7))-methyltransferase RsmG [Candidatus Absconditicoccus praedator]